MGRGFIKAGMFHLLLEVAIGIRVLAYRWEEREEFEMEIVLFMALYKILYHERVGREKL